MLEIIFHQVFWGLFSFSLFFFLIKRFVIANIIKIENKRSGYIEKLTEQINSMQEKSKLLNNIASKIINEEIPEKQRLYIDQNLEPVLSEIKVEQLNYRQMLNDKLAQIKKKDFEKEILKNEKLLAQLDKLAIELVDSMQG